MVLRHPGGHEMSQADASAPRGSSLSLEHWIALNDEIVALVRAGLPLDRGLLDVGTDAPRDLAAISRDLGARLQRGEGLSAAIDAERGRLPGLYRAVVEAGVRSGRLSSALEGLATYARSVLEMRRAVSVALIYPLIVAMLAYALFVAFTVLAVPQFLASFESFRLPGLGLLRAFDAAGRTALYWAPILPALLVLLAIGWMVGGRAQAFGAAPGRGLVARLPWTRSLLDDSAAASFSELLALLVEHGVSFPDAIELSGQASGNPALEAEARGVAAAVRRGDAPDAVAQASRRGGLPALLGWLLGSGYRQGTLVAALRHAAVTYRRRTVDRAELVRRFLPVLAVLVFGGLTVLAYTLALFVPYSALLRQLSDFI